MDYSLALVAGTLLALSFPKFGHPLVAWIALVPLVIAILRGGGSSSAARSFRLGLATGAGYFAGTLYWIAHVTQTYGGLSGPVAVLIAATLVAYLALFPAFFAGTIARLGRRSREMALLLSPAVWVATELARSLTHLAAVSNRGCLTCPKAPGVVCVSLTGTDSCGDAAV